MKRLNDFSKATALLGAMLLSSIVGLPALAQSTPGSGTATEQNTQPGTSQPGMAQPGATPRSTTASINSLDREFIRMAAQGNLAEIQTSQMALQKASNQTVKDYAQRMIQEHTTANQQLGQVAAQYGISLPTTPDPLNVAIAQQLMPLTGAEFDRAYMLAQENAHLRTIALYRTAIAQGQSPAVQRYASTLLPSINNHYQMASQAIGRPRVGNTQRSPNP